MIQFNFLIYSLCFQMYLTVIESFQLILSKRKYAIILYLLIIYLLTIWDFF